MTADGGRSPKQQSRKWKRKRDQSVAIAPIHRVADLQRMLTMPPPQIAFMEPQAVLSFQNLLGNRAVINLLGLGEPDLDEAALEEETAGTTDPRAEFTPEVLDQIVTEVIAEQLRQYQNIAVVVEEDVPVESGADELPSTDGGGPAEPATKKLKKTVKVRAVYFITRHKKKVEAARKSAGFDQIANAIDDQLSLLMGGSGGNIKDYYTLKSGVAVEIGKATPEDLTSFMNKAVESGALHRYARQQGLLEEGGLLVDLGDEALRDLIQGWMDATGVGVDCSGFINIVMVRAREKVREDMRAAGVPEEELPRSLARMQRPMLNKDKEVTTPAELRPGDVWVTNKAAHVRVVMSVSEAVNQKGNPVIEFVTAESSNSGDRMGPMEKKWQTATMKQIQTISNVAGGGPKDGQFFRMKRAI